jgi:four helix bundle protein
MSFKKLHVWQKGIIVAKEIYALTKLLPNDEIYGLTSQMRRAAVSIPSNIAEGAERRSKKEFHHFVMIARGSAAELNTQLILVRELYNLPIDGTMETLNEVQKMLTHLERL